MPTRIKETVFGALFAFVSATTLIADQDTYSLTVQNLQVGTLKFTHEIKGTEYHSLANFATTGLAGALFNMQISATSNGQGVHQGVYDPKVAQIITTTDGQKSTLDLEFSDGTLTDFRSDPRVVSTIKPETQLGAIDPVTALSYVLRPMPQDRLCQLSVIVFDGVVSNRLVLNRPTLRKDGRFQCSGGIERLAGYSEEQIKAQGDVFYFTVLFRVDPASGGYKFDRLVGQSEYGQFQLLRDF